MSPSLRLLLALVLVGPAAAQAPNPADPCTPGRAQAALRGLDVQAQLFNTGSLFFGGTTTNGDGYLVPLSGEDAGKSPLFVANLWVGGTVGGALRTAAARYTNFHYAPGQAGPDGTPPTPAECADADRIWVVSRYDVEQYLRTGVATADLADWPVALGAPVLDGDGVAGNYDLAAGDQPAIRGDVTAFWAMTDLAIERDPAFFPGAGPLGVDVTGEAFAFLTPQPTLAQTTVYRFTVTNRNAIPIDSLYVGLFMDPDLGNASDDFIGTDTTLAMVYVYNADNEDEGSVGYGIPPAFGAVFLETPARSDGQPLGLSRTSYFVSGASGGQAGDPSTPEQYYRYLRGRWGDGSVQRERSTGYQQPASASPSRYLFPGDPVAGQPWSEVNNGTAKPVNPTGDRREVGSTGPVRLAPGASVPLTFALVFGQGTDRFDSIRVLRARAGVLHALQAAGRLEAVAVTPPTRPPTPYGIARPSPNPFVGTTTIRLDGLAGVPVRVRVLDVLGREVLRLDVTPSRNEEPIRLGAGLAPGTYVVEVTGSAFVASLLMAKIR